MFDTAPNASSQRNFGRSARLVLTAAAFTLLAGGTALATASTSSGTDTHQGPAAQSLLHADNSNITETAEAPEAVDPVTRRALPKVFMARASPSSPRTQRLWAGRMD